MSLVIKKANIAVRQIKTPCLSHYSYMIESRKEMAVVDPLRDVAEYLKVTEESKANLKYIIETHYHADFVSGFWDLAQKSGAQIIFGPDTKPKFDSRIVKHGDILELGDCKIKVLHTPGHTLESTCYVLMDNEGKPLCVFTGDTLFLGDVGRPDLAQKAGSLTDKDLARMLFHSLKHLKELPDDCLVLPTHGAGSACGKNISTGDVCNIGTQKIKNTAFAEENVDAFIEMTTSGLPKPPTYFINNVKMNKEGKVIIFNQAPYFRRSV